MKKLKTLNDLNAKLQENTTDIEWISKRELKVEVIKWKSRK